MFSKSIEFISPFLGRYWICIQGSLLTVTSHQSSESPRCAFVFFEGLLPTVIDSQVLTHVRPRA